MITLFIEGIWDKIFTEAGLVAAILAIGVIVLYRDNQKMQGKMVKNAENDIRVSTKMLSFLDRLASEQGKGEARLRDIIRSDGEATRELLLIQKTNAIETLKTATNAKDTPAA